jgi:hypothetical protein
MHATESERKTPTTIIGEPAMKTTPEDQGVIHTLLERFNEFRLPRLLRLKERVDAGEPLTDEDLEFLREAFEDAERAKPLFDRHPEYQDLGARVVRLYAEITAKALENEG